MEIGTGTAGNLTLFLALGVLFLCRGLMLRRPGPRSGSACSLAAWAMAASLSLLLVSEGLSAYQIAGRLPETLLLARTVLPPVLLAWSGVLALGAVRDPLATHARLPVGTHAWFLASSAATLLLASFFLVAWLAESSLVAWSRGPSWGTLAVGVAAMCGYVVLAGSLAMAGSPPADTEA